MFFDITTYKIFDLEVTYIPIREELALQKYFAGKISNGTMAQAWRGGIGKYPPNPERLAIPS